MSLRNFSSSVIEIQCADLQKTTLQAKNSALKALFGNLNMLAVLNIINALEKHKNNDYGYS
jgi:hypothetical protein